MPTPDVEGDVLDLLNAQPSLNTNPAITIFVKNTNAFMGKQKPSKDSGVPNDATFIELMGALYMGHNRGNVRIFLVDIVKRGPRSGDTAVKTSIRAIEDAINDHLHADGVKHGTFGPWTAPGSNVKYIDLRVTAIESLGYADDDSVTWIAHAEAWFDG